MNAPLISVIIPVYNVEYYISKCLDSLLSQSYQHLEIICVEDCSTDNSPRILEYYSKNDDRIKIVYHTENGGLSKARNSGINIASGEYLTFIDSDDFVSENFVEELVRKAIESNSDVVVSSTVGFNGDLISDELITQSRIAFSDIYGHELILKEMINFPVTAWAKLYKTSFLKAHNIRFIDGLLHEDEPWSMIIFSRVESIAFATNAYYFYRIKREGSITAIRDQITIDYCNKYLDMLKKMADIACELRKEKLFTNSAYDIYMEKILKMSYWTLKKLNRSSCPKKEKNRVNTKYKSFLNSLGIYENTFWCLVASFFNRKAFDRNKIIYKLFSF